MEDEMARTKKSLPAKIDWAYLLGFGFLSEICPKGLIEDVLANLDKLSQRIRLFPATVVVYFIITMSLWRESPLEEVLKILVNSINFATDGQNSIICPGKASISRARTKLGPKVMRELAERVIGPIASIDAQEAWYKGMRLMALDGSTFDLPDETENVNYFGYPSSSRGDTAFPQARILSLVETGTHIVTAAEIGPYKRSEQEMAAMIIKAGKLKPDMLLMADRNFYGYGLWSKAIATGAKLLWRIKSNLRLPAEQRLPDGSYISTVYDSTNRANCLPYKVRVVEYCLKNKSNINDEHQVGVELYRLLTNIYDSELAPGTELAGLYHERWEIESLFGEFKKHILCNSTVIRSKTPLLVEQELWGLIILHFAIRKIITQAAWKHKTDPDKLSFKNAVFVVKRNLPQFAAFPPTEEEPGDTEEEIS
jgi:hypothetical protein